MSDIYSNYSWAIVYNLNNIDIKYRFISDDINNNIVKLEWISSDNQIADIFTKNLGLPLFRTFRNSLITKQGQN